MPCLINHEIHYSDLSLLEAMWKIMKHIKGREEIDIVLRGVDLMRRTLKHEELDERSVEIAFEMYAKGHRDLIDNLLYGISVSKQLSFLTIDKELLQFIKNKSFTNILISPDDIKNHCI
jgi:predicted nucleic acid-binding protein